MLPPVAKDGHLPSPTRPSELEAIYERMGQVVNAAFTDLGVSQMTDMSW